MREFFLRSLADLSKKGKTIRQTVVTPIYYNYAISLLFYYCILYLYNSAILIL